jgi:hypothetical protein
LCKPQISIRRKAENMAFLLLNQRNAGRVGCRSLAEVGATHASPHTHQRKVVKKGFLWQDKGSDTDLSQEEIPMETLPQIATAMKNLLEVGSDEIGRSSGFIQRQVKLSGSGFVKALVFGFLSNPEMTYGELGQSAASIGLEMSVQGLEQRFTYPASEFMRKVLEKAVGTVIEADKVALPILDRFEGIYLRDSSVIPLPGELKGIWHGVGGALGESAALKLQVSWDYRTGQLQGLALQDGCAQDQTSPFQAEQLPAGGLQLADLGYFSLDRLEKDHAAGVFWVTRWKTGTVLFHETGERMDLLSWLRSQDPRPIDYPVLLGATHRIPCRLLVFKVPQAVADRRRRRMRAEARKKQQPLTEERLALAAWTLVLTNTPPNMLSLAETLVMLRVRWQVELLFKLWKSHAKVDEWRSQNPWRILCEIYAKLIGLIISQWIFMACTWQFPDRSLVKAAKTIRKFGSCLALAVHNTAKLIDTLDSIKNCLRAAGCRLEKRNSHPATFQLLTGLPKDCLR